MKAAGPVVGKTEITLEDAREMFKEAVAGIQMRGKAIQGEKTMLDALIPAYESLNVSIESGVDVKTALSRMCETAARGVEYTKTIQATKGRASYLGERSIGHQDPGATSSLLTLEAIRDFF